MATKAFWNQGVEKPQAMFCLHPNPALPPCKQLPPHDGVHGVELVIRTFLEVAPAVHGQEHSQGRVLVQHFTSQQPPPLTLFKAN